MSAASSLRLPRLATFVFASLVLFPLPARAQLSGGIEDPGDSAQYRSGTLAWSPALVFSTGHDTNVYREPVGFRDYETFFVPQIEAWWIHPGYAVRAQAAVEVVHFMDNVGATNTQIGVGWERRTSAIRPWVHFNRRRTNANPTGFEAGYKSLRLESDINGGVAFHMSPRSQTSLFARTTRTGWDADAIYQGSILQQNLNRVTTGFGASYSYAITPLTSVGGGVESFQDRFRYAPSRDGRLMTVRGQVDFARPALIFGRVSIGQERFSAGQSGAADYSGLAVQTNIGYGSPERTLVKFSMNQGTQYSVDTALGYYVLTGYTLSVSRRINQTLEAAVFANRFGMDYRPSLLAAALGRVDIVTEYGGVVAYRVGRRGKVGTSVERATKSGPWGYEAVRVVAFLTYGSGRFQRLDRPTPLER
jgi:hypothetical protein